MSGSQQPGSKQLDAIDGETNETLSQSPSASTCYRRKVKTNDQCEVISNAICVTVNPTITNNIISSTQERCVNFAPAIINGVRHLAVTLHICLFMGNKYGFSCHGSANAATQNYQPPTYNAAGIHFFRRNVTSGNCTDVSNVDKSYCSSQFKSNFYCNRF